MRYILINDYFSDDLAGGGHAGGAALNDEIIFDIFTSKDEDIQKIKSRYITEDLLEKEKDSFFVISNFFHIHPDILRKFHDLKYIVYAHDYKFVEHMNPARYDDFLVPKEEIINAEFFQNAKAIVCQTSLQATIYKRNLENVNVVNFSGNLWSNEILDYLATFCDAEKVDRCSIVKSHYPEKGVPEALKYCIDSGFDYEIIHDSDYKAFLSKMAKNKGLVFWPKTPETCGRMILEAKMMNIKVFANELLGSRYESWFELDGVELIDKMKSKHEDVYKLITDIAHERV